MVCHLIYQKQTASNNSTTNSLQNRHQIFLCLCSAGAAADERVHAVGEGPPQEADRQRLRRRQGLKDARRRVEDAV